MGKNVKKPSVNLNTVVVTTMFSTTVQSACKRILTNRSGHVGVAYCLPRDIGVIFRGGNDNDFARSARAVEVLSRLYGLHDGYPYTHDGVACALGIPVQEVHDIEATWHEHIADHFAETLADTRETWLRNSQCPECKAHAGEVHAFGCSLEECPFCHGLVWKCPCSYKHLKLGWGGRSATEWRALRKQHGKNLDRSKYVVPLTMEQKRNWSAIVTQKGAIRYGSERRFQ